MGEPPVNYDFSAESISVGTPPTNHDFETGNFANWDVSGSVTLLTDAEYGYWAELKSSAILVSDAFVVDPNAQQILFDLGHLSSSYSYLEVYSLTGSDYTTETRITTFWCNNCGWQTKVLDPTPFRGQAIKLKFKRTGGTLGIDNLRTMAALADYTTTGTVERAEDESGNPYAKLRNGGSTITTAPLLVDSTTQQVSVRLGGLSSGSDQYQVDLLSGADFTTTTKLVLGTNVDQWQTFWFDVSAWPNQQVKLRIKALYGAIGVADIGLQRVVAPDWTVKRDTYIENDADGNPYISTNGTLVSPAFTLPADIQQILIRHRGTTASNSFEVKLLYGSDFSQEKYLGTSHRSQQGAWQTLKLGIGAHAGESVKIKLRPYGRIHLDDVAMGETLIPGWQTTKEYAVAVGEDQYGVYVISEQSIGAVALRSQKISNHIIDTNGLNRRYFSFAYDIGYKTSSLAQVSWTNEAGQSWVVFSKAADTPTGYTVGHFWLADFMGERGSLSVYATSGGKIYSVAGNTARQQLNEPFAHKVGLQIDTSTGAFGYQAQDVVTDGLLPLNFARYYNGHAATVGPLGHGWSHTYETRLVFTDEGHAGVVFGSGREAFFEWNSFSKKFTSSDVRIHDKLVKESDGTYTLTTKGIANIALMRPAR
ncbi:MAG: DUF6531 domain-containing protein [Caldilineaceae bacterium]